MRSIVVYVLSIASTLIIAKTVAAALVTLTREFVHSRIPPQEFARWEKRTRRRMKRLFGELHWAERIVGVDPLKLVRGETGYKMLFNLILVAPATLTAGLISWSDKLGTLSLNLDSPIIDSLIDKVLSDEKFAFAFLLTMVIVLLEDIIITILLSYAAPAISGKKPEFPVSRFLWSWWPSATVLLILTGLIVVAWLQLKGWWALFVPFLLPGVYWIFVEYSIAIARETLRGSRESS